MGAFRWLRDHYVAIQVVSGAIMVALGLLLFFARFYVLRIYLNRFLGRARDRAGLLRPAASVWHIRWNRPERLLASNRGHDPARRCRPLLSRASWKGCYPAHHLVTKDSTHPPDLVICDIARVDPLDVADAWPDIPIRRLSNHTDTAGLRRGPPSRISVSLRETPEGVELRVADDGGQERRQAVLDGLTQRAAELNGSFASETTDAGTWIAVRLPPSAAHL